MKNLFKTKSLEALLKQPGEGTHALKRILGPVNLTTLGIGGIIGAGIFVLTGQAAAQYAGPAIVLSFIISGFACAFAGLCYAEFASMIPIAGSAYTYAYATLGELFAWIIGWDLVLEYLFGASTVAVGWSGYVVSFLKDMGVVIPPELTAATGKTLIQLPQTGWTMLTGAIASQLQATGVDPATLPQVTAYANVPAMFIVAAVTVLLVVGIKESANFNNVIVILKICVILMFVIFGFKYIQSDNWTPFIPANTGEFGQFGWSGIWRGAGVIFFAYIGFDAVSTAAQEAKNPQRDMPIGILVSLGVCTVLYIIVALVLTGVVKYTNLMVPDPIAVAVNAAGDGLYWLRPIIKVGAIAGLSSVVLVLLLGQPRIFFSMANDGLLPAAFAKVHPRFQTPYIPTIITGVIAMIIAGMLPINILGELVSIGTLLAFVIVCVGVLVLRYKRPDIKRAFKTPLVPYVPVLGALAALSQMAGLPLDTWIRLIVWMVLGLAIYFLYGRYHSKLRK
ncbi:MAG: amino acid permease [Bdellovibrionales bacterium RIFOXYD1_FULL_53_11]|nr:MAG: amino acid permease [Bdellovibrionales bacterium RIFOXYD1_FULL_53_11]